MTLPVVVSIVQMPPEIVLGTEMRPVVLWVKKIFSLQSVPLTLPVVVITVISPASHLSKTTFPVLLLIEKLSVAKALDILIVPVLPVETSVLHFTSSIVTFPVLTDAEIASQDTAETAILPVVVVRSASFNVISERDILPVVVSILQVETVELQATFPVVPLILISLKENSLGRSTLAVLESTFKEA